MYFLYCLKMDMLYFETFSPPQCSFNLFFSSLIHLMIQYLASDVVLLVLLFHLLGHIFQQALYLHIPPTLPPSLLEALSLTLSRNKSTQVTSFLVIVGIEIQSTSWFQFLTLFFLIDLCCFPTIKQQIRRLRGLIFTPHIHKKSTLLMINNLRYSSKKQEILRGGGGGESILYKLYPKTGYY